MGRISLPHEYPLKPPSFEMLTPSGRFETGVKICLSISNYHEELWSPSWSVRLALVALAAFMPTPAGGAIGGLVRGQGEGGAGGRGRGVGRLACAASGPPRPLFPFFPPFFQDYTPDERRALAAASRVAPPKAGSAPRQEVVDRLHARLLAAEAGAKSEGEVGGQEGAGADEGGAADAGPP